MDKKWLPLTVVLGVAGVAAVTASLWPDEEKPPLAQTLCHGALSRQTAELIDDGKGGEVSAEEWESKGQSADYAVFKACSILRANADNDYPRGIYKLVIEDNRNDPGYKPKDSVPLGPGFTGWVLPDKAEANLPAGCAARMGSTAPYITVTLLKPSKKGEEEEKDLVDRDTAIRNNAAVVREAATKLAKKYGCGA
ncbi:hypothetical protein QCN29_06705 [Streptomyces sp. HNM0663]|uniref:Secreted protein n=1 Tax=Streptomyces chengmaiensis TaxID=3040919 RepID=A0ABT6HIG4_9ACTN|nr:hypothetical protein [Streptomyces chengmaiensis]MDH2388478.1 hypothetical protein [Streptomyces chengmaiensis]